MGRSLSFKNIVYMNLPAELTQLLRLHGLYPIPSPGMAKFAPDLKIGNLHIVEKKTKKGVKDDCVSLRSCIERNKLAKFGSLMKRHILSPKTFDQKGRVPSL